MGLVSEWFSLLGFKLFRWVFSTSFGLWFKRYSQISSMFVKDYILKLMKFIEGGGFAGILKKCGWWLMG